MKTSTSLLLALVVLGVAGAGGYWLGARAPGTAPGATATGAAAAPAKRRLLYYRNPMGLPDTSPTPKKDPMGMDYVAVYEGEEEDDGGAAGPAGANQIRISTDKIQKLGVRFEAVSLRALGKTVRAAGRVEPDERRVYAISPKFEGYVERLFVNFTGQPVGRGQPLFEVYSPELASAQREYAIAAQGVQALKHAGGDAAGGMKQLTESSLTRLRNWDLPPEQVKALVATGEAKRTMIFRSPVSGLVTEKKALQGMRFMPGEALYQVTDLSSVWVLADVYEQDIGLVKLGAQATVTISSYPDRVFSGKITYVYPTLTSETRTVPVRIELANPGLLLKPSMFAQVEVVTGGKEKVLTVPDSAVIDSGKRQIVLVQAKEGRFEPREVKVGARSDNYIEVREGLREGEQVVVVANFLIDAESNLKAAVGGMGAHAGHGSAPKAGADAPKAGADAPAPQPASAPAAAGHKGQGKVESIDAKAGTVSLEHGPIATLNWPAMTMEFKLANAALAQGVRPGASVAFEFVERQPGEWVVTAIKPAGGGHSGH